MAGRHCIAALSAVVRPSPVIKSLRPLLQCTLPLQPTTLSPRLAHHQPSHSIFTQTICRRSAIPTNPSSHKSPSPSATKQPTPASNKLTWDAFFALRTLRRRISLTCSIAAGLATILVTTPLMAAAELETTIARTTGIDPMIGIGIAVLGAGGLGTLIFGPLLSGGIFRLWKGRYVRVMKDMENVFLGRHVRRFRADPASSSLQSPIPDYYGEKVGSVAGYRRWLRDQRAFTRKTSKDMI